MKRLLISMAILLAVVGCTKQDDTSSDNLGSVDPPEFEINFETSSIFTDEAENGLKLTWTEGDLFSCFFNTGGQAKYEYTGKTGEDSGSIKAVSCPEGSMLDTFYAVYPYNETNTFSNGALTITLPAKQTYTEGTFGANSNTMIAVNTDKELSYTFSNVCGYVRLKVYGEATITSITFKGNNEDVITGQALINPTTKTLVMTGSGKSITLGCGKGVKLGTSETEATSFWLAVPPKTFTRGFTVTLTDVEGKSMEKNFNTSLTIERNKVYDSVIEYDTAPAVVDPNILFDAKFNADGSASNIGSIPGLTIEAKMGTFIKTAQRGDDYVAVFGGAHTLKDNEVHTDGFYYIDYSTNDTFKNHLSDGFTMEVLCKPYLYRGNFWATPFSTTTNRVFHNEVEWGKAQWSFASCTAENEWTNKGIFGGWWWFDSVTTNSAEHIVLTFDGNDTYSLFVNGTEYGPFKNSTAFKPGNAMAIGALAYTEGKVVHRFCGEIAIARVYDSAKSKNEVVTRYNELKPAITALNTAQVPTSNAKRVSIIGDSYSTFNFYSNVDISGKMNGYSAMYPYYPDERIKDIRAVTDTWWGMLCTTDEFRLEANNSYGGSTICNLSYGNDDVSNKGISFIDRVGLNKNGVDTMGNPDIILIFGGTNDSWANSRMGKFVFSDWTYYELMSFRGGFAKLITKLKERYPNAQIYNICNVSKYDGRPGITKRAAESMAYICKQFNIPNIQLDLTKEYPDMRPEKPGEDHPVKAGMQHIFEQVYAVLTGAAEPTPYPEEKPMDSHPALDGEPIEYSITQNMFIEYKTGKDVALPKDKTWTVTNFITIPNNATHISVNPITVYNDGANGNQTTPIAFYDANMTYLKDKSVAPIGTCATEILNLPIPEEAAYVRFCWTDTPYTHHTTEEIVETYGELNAVWHIN